MKVCTDSCLFGALLPALVNKSVLDIGTGTGLLTLMLAQKSLDCSFTCIEIDENAAEQARENLNNFDKSVCAKVLNVDFLQWSKESNSKFDIIVTNPPFFEKSLLSSKEIKNIAKHNLDIKSWVDAILNVSKSNTYIYILLPPAESAKFTKIMHDHNWYLIEKTNISNTQNSNIIRQVSVFSNEKKLILESDIAIYQLDNLYTPIFQNLLSPYYLYL
jgi:tRNA1Val (adenine37-N6)-methyltransferase